MEVVQILITDYFCKVCGKLLVTEHEITTSICSDCLTNEYLEDITNDNIS